MESYCGRFFPFVVQAKKGGDFNRLVPAMGD